MSKSVIERLRRARQSQVSSGGRNFTIRRPTDLEMYEVAGRVNQRDLLARFVVDWGAMPEMDLIPGGGPDPVPFDPDLWAEWIADHPEHWDAITDAIVAAYSAHKAQREETVKNSAPGSAA